MRGLVLSSLLFAAAPTEAASLEAGGYLKNLWQYGRSLTDAKRFWQDQSRVSLQFDASSGPFVAYVDYRLEYVLGTFKQTRDFQAFGFPVPAFWWNLEHEISDGRRHSLRQGVFRGWAGFSGERTVLRLGRQRVAWGTGKVWNPTDILNEYQPLSVEAEERHGVDAFYARRALGVLSQAELVWAPQPDWERSALLARWRTNLAGWDLSVMGGKAPRERDAFIAGGDFAVDSFDGTFSGEVAYRDPGNPAPPAIPAALVPAGVNFAPRPVFWRGSLGYEYRWGTDAPWAFLLKDAWARVEFYRNGNGAEDPANYSIADLIRQDELFLARHYGALLYERELTPLWTAAFRGILNADDESFYLAPSLRWNPHSDLYLTASVQVFSGKAGTEYGSLGTTPFVVAQFYF